MKRLLSDAQALRAVREFFTSASHAPASRYARAADGEPMWIWCRGEGCAYLIELAVTQ